MSDRQTKHHSAAIAVRLAIVSVLVLFGGEAAAQQVTDGAKRPTDIHAMDFAVPQTLDRQDLFDVSNWIVMPRLDVERLLREDEEADWGPLRAGVVQEVSPGEAVRGYWTQLYPDGWVWTLWVEAPGAKAMRLRLRDWASSPEGELVIYSPGSEQYAIGPMETIFTLPREELWTPTTYGDRVHVEYYVEAADVGSLPNPPIQLDGILNQYRFFPDLEKDGDRELDCHLDVTCYPSLQDVAQAIGALSWVSSQYGFFCTGAMLNRNPTDFTPLFMTANHCNVSAGNVSNLLVTWFFQTQTCNGDDAPHPSTLPQTPGLLLLGVEIDADYTLVGLSTESTAGVFYLGWDPGYMPNGTLSVGIHHPDHSYKRCSFGPKIDDVISCADGESFLVELPDGNGLIEPGCSGSPLLDMDFRVRGTASCAKFECDRDNWCAYGRFDVAFPRFEPYLAPVDPIYVDHAYSGFERGTVGQPFNTVHEGVFAVRAGSNVHIESGSYPEEMRINKATTLNGRNGVVTIGR